jgi:hypothetical protein
MNLDKKLLVCESMLARLDAAMASAEAEVGYSSALEDYLRRLLENLDAEQARLDRNIRSVVLTHDNSPGSARGTAWAQEDAGQLEHLHEQMTRIRAVQNRLHLLLDAAESVAQHP